MGVGHRLLDLYDDALFQTGVEQLHWDDANSQWIISTDRGDRMTARFVAMANGRSPSAKPYPNFRKAWPRLPVSPS